MKIKWLIPLVCLISLPGFAKIKGGESVSANINVTSSQMLESASRIHQAGASYIKVHFKSLELPKGMAVVVSNESGTEQYHYGPGLNTPFTTNASIGDNGVTSFSAMSITGDTAIIKVVGTADPSMAQIVPNVVVDQYYQGLPENQWAAYENSIDGDFESICGIDNKEPAVCYAQSEPEIYERSKPVVRLLMGGSVCTAWRVGSGGYFLTNNHCFSTQAGANNSEVQFNYQQTSCTGGSATSFKLSVDQMIKTNASKDYTLFTVNGLAQAEAYGYLGLDPRRPTLYEKIFIPQHPGGRKKELGVYTDTGLCQIDAATANNVDTGYKCDTEGGSSGSPVFARSSNKVIALHHLGGCSTSSNKGVRLELIWPEIQAYFNNQIPDDSFGNDGNTAPTASFTENCTELSCSFDASASSDSDGQIASYAWSFGDGQSATGAVVSHNYISSSSYSVTLTVVDNQGKASSASKNINVNSGSNKLTNGQSIIIAGQKSSLTNYVIDVPAGARNLSITTTQGSGDADLFVKAGSTVSKTNYDCRSWSSTSNESCSFATTTQGSYQILVHAYSAYANVNLTASYETGTVSNLPPTASFTSSVNKLAVSFSDTSTDSDGTIASRAWSFGDNSTSSQTNPTHTYAKSGSYQVSLTVTDNNGATSTTTKNITVDDGVTGGSCTVAAWQADQTYLGGDQASYLNKLYKAAWWTRGSNPADHSGPHEEWVYLHDC